MIYKILLFLAPIVLACNVFADPPKKPSGGQTETKVRIFKFNVYMLDGGNMWWLRPESIGVDVQHEQNDEYNSIFSENKEVIFENTKELSQLNIKKHPVGLNIKKIQPKWNEINGYDLIYKGKNEYDLI